MQGSLALVGSGEFLPEMAEFEASLINDGVNNGKRKFRSGSSLAGCSAGAMVLSSHIPNFRLTKSEPTQGLDLLPNARVIPHFDKFFRWIPSSAAKILMHAPDNVILLGIDELTAIVKRSGEKRWMVEGRAKVHILQGLPKQELQHGEMIQLDPV